MYKLSPQPEHKELFVTSYSRHAPVGGKQGGIQPGCNQYQSFYMLVSFFVGQWSLYGFISCCYKIQISCSSGGPRGDYGGTETKRSWWRRRGGRNRRRMIEEKAAALLSRSANISTYLWFNSEVVLGEPYFKWPPTDLWCRRRRYFTHGLKQDVDFSIEGAVNSHRHKDHRHKESLPGKTRLAPLARFSRGDWILSSINFPIKSCCVCVCVFWHLQLLGKVCI